MRLDIQNDEKGGKLLTLICDDCGAHLPFTRGTIEILWRTHATDSRGRCSPPPPGTVSLQLHRVVEN